MTTTTNTQTSFWAKNCHKGNTPIYTEPNGGTLFIGGWSNDAYFDWNTHVIDLTGSEHKYINSVFAFDAVSEQFLQFVDGGYAGWLSLPFPDYGTPKNITTLEQWEGMASTIQNILKSGTDVLVACHGGHGRSGLFCSIVGYILNIDTDPSWFSPVEKIRKIHCFEAVETYNQEKFVYDVLGLEIAITHVYVDNTTKTFKSGGMTTYRNCPICNTQSMYVDSIGMCLGCKTKYEKIAPERADLTLDDIKDRGKVEHVCTSSKCVGIWKAQKCGHVVHDKIVYEGWCDDCWAENEYAERSLAGKVEEEDDEVSYAPCANCGSTTVYGARYGICYECQDDVAKSGKVDWVHNTLTDPYRAHPHTCSDPGCVGIVIADICGHVLHNREVEDGICPQCQIDRGTNKKVEVK